MPSIAAHMVVAKLVGEKLNVYDDDFIKGNLLPDIIDYKDSHHKIKGKYYEIADIDYFIDKLDLDDHLSLGYLTHLLLDKYYLEDYIYQVADGKNVFESKEIYTEYGYVTFSLLKLFSVDREKVMKSLQNYTCLILQKKYENNLKWFNLELEPNNLKYLPIDKFSEFLKDSSEKIIKDIKGVKKDEHQFSKCYISFR